MEDKEILKTIGNRIKTARERNNLSVETISASLGIDSNLWAAYEDGLYMPDLGLLISISNELNISLNYLVSHDNDITKPSTMLEELSDEELLERNATKAFCRFLDALHKLPEDNKCKLLSKLQNMTNNPITE